MAGYALKSYGWRLVGFEGLMGLCIKSQKAEDCMAVLTPHVLSSSKGCSLHISACLHTKLALQLAQTWAYQ